MEKFEIRFSDIDWGEDEARNDVALAHYFVEFPGFEKILKGQKRFIIGRKGTGKSAILQKIRLQCDSDPQFFYVDVSLRDFPLNDFKSLGDRSLQDKSKYVSAWKFLLLVDIADLFIEHISIQNSEELDVLTEFINDNFPDGISVAETISKLRQNENKISMVLSILSGEHSSLSGTETTAQIHYNRAVKTLEGIFAKIRTNSTFVLLIDELDEGYRAQNTNLNLVILSLLRAADELYNLYKKNSVKCIPILSLRSDIFDSLEDNDLNKLDDYVLRLDWTTNESSPWSLKRIVDKRIEATVKAKYPTVSIDNYWSLVSDNDTVPKGLFQYICALTFSRPRDIIKLLKYCSNAKSIARLTLKDVQSIEENYSGWFYREFRDEAQSFLPCWKNALNCISEIAKGKCETQVLLEKFNSNTEIKNWCLEHKKNALDVLKILFNYSVVGCINEEGRWIFKYKDEDFDFMESYPYYCVHYGFCRKLRIPKSYDRTIVNVLCENISK